MFKEKKKITIFLYQIVMRPNRYLVKLPLPIDSIGRKIYELPNQRQQLPFELQWQKI
jgi:hypothetical protein